MQQLAAFINKAGAYALVTFIGTTTLGIRSTSAKENMFYGWWGESSQSQLMQWRETARYRSEDGSTVRVMVKLLKSYWDEEAQKKRILFELRLEGKDQAEYEGDFLCRNDGRGVSLVQESENNVSESFRKKHMHNSIMLSLHRYCNLHGISTNGEQ